MGAGKRPETLNKFLGYVLGRRPDEFGLVPDQNGWVKIKDLIRALSEEKGWRHVRRGHINEVMLTVSSPLIETVDEKIRGAQWDGAFHKDEAGILPKLLYVGIRQKTYPVIHEGGIFPVGSPQVILCREREMALRIGKRRDSKPTVLIVNTDQALGRGVVFLEKGELLFCADHVPVGCFTGPPLPPPKPESPKKPKPEKDPAEAMGAFILDIGAEPAIPASQGKGGKKGGCDAGEYGYF